MSASLIQRNPFATCFTRPGRIPYLFPPGCNALRLIRQLQTNQGWGQIIGPHGAGKSTLLTALLPHLEHAARHLIVVELHDGQRRLPVELHRSAFKPGAQIVVDGYEQLSLLERRRLKHRCRVTGSGLLATAHASVGLPELFCIRNDVSTAWRIVQALPGCDPSIISDELIESCFHSHRGNMREMLFALYDVYERCR